MFDHWGEFYLLAGSAAAVLIGLIFVVVTLMQDRPRSTVLTGARVYMGPIVLQVSFVLVLSAAALIPHITPHQMALLAGLIALWGLARAIYSIFGIRGFRDQGQAPDWTDIWCYGAIPAVLFVLLAGVALAFWSGSEWATAGLAGTVVGLLLLAIRNEWDLVTWLTPRPDSPKKKR